MIEREDLKGMGLYLFNGESYIADESLTEEEFGELIELKIDDNL